ncbi:MAG TPA: XrtA system polysaccharide deacetylase [Rhizomicrobium sp.]|jgi:polysaccharide deacetylase family protein (PEP-CTERM system associated)
MAGALTRKLSAPVVNALSVDVEDYYQVQALSSVCARPDWDKYESRVERNTDLILDVLAQSGAKATFFTLGWIAQRHPDLIRRIADAGHEVACHGLCHARVDSQTAEEFRTDIRTAKKILEDVAGQVVNGYRAATFSVGPHTPWAWPVLEEEGFLYSSSVYPVVRDLYGFPDAPRTPYRPVGTERLLEIPIATVRLMGRNWPGGGGGYFRLLPYGVSRAAIAWINRVDRVPAVFYLHPWEVDPNQPRVHGLPAKSRFRHYINLARTEPRLRRLTRDFRWDRVDTTFGVSRASTGLPGHAAG